jgi:hypothetical protein
MTPVQLSKLWTAVGLASLFFALNSWLATQGGAEIFDAKLLASGRVPVALTGIPICTVLLALSAVIGILYGRRMPGRWHARIPIIGFEAIKTGSTEGRIYQGAALFVLTIIPLAATAHFWRVLGSAHIVTTGAGARALQHMGLVRADEPR